MMEAMIDAPQDDRPPSPTPWRVVVTRTQRNYGRGPYEIVDADGETVVWMRGGRKTTLANAHFIVCLANEAMGSV